MHRPDTSHTRVTAAAATAPRGAFARRLLLVAALVGALLFVISDGASAAALPVTSSDAPAVEQQGRDNGNNGNNGNGRGNLVDKGRRIPEFPSTAVAGLFAIGAVGGYLVYQRRRSDAPQR